VWRLRRNLIEDDFEDSCFKGYSSKLQREYSQFRKVLTSSNITTAIPKTLGLYEWILIEVYRQRSS
jgi:hypothetical protein